MTTDTLPIPGADRRLRLLRHALPNGGGLLSFVRSLREYGPIVRFSAGPKSLTVVNDPDLVHEMLTAKANQFSKGLLFEQLKLFGRNALPVAEGKPHLARRRTMQPAFHRELIGGYVEKMRQVVTRASESWSPGATLDLKTEMQLITQGAVMSAMFSSDPPREPAHVILRSVDTVFGAALRRALLPVAALRSLPTPGNRRLREASEVLHSTVADIIAAHEAAPDRYDDIVSLLLAARDPEGAPLPDDEILSEVIGLLAAGSETTAVVAAWLFHELSRDPDLEARLHGEVDTVLAGEQLSYEHIPRLAFTGRLVKETLRMYSPAWIVTRQVLETVRLGPYELPAGTDILFSPYALHRDAAVYPDAERFDPDRWLPERPQPPKHAYIPFGAGKRVCLGDQFAQTEAIVIAALVASRWRLRPAPDTDARPVGAITVHPAGLRMVAEARRHAPVGSPA